MVKKLVLMFCLLSFTGLSLGLAGEETIGYLFKDKGNGSISVKVYVKEVINQSGQSQIIPETFKKKLEESLRQRRSMDFKVVKSPAESDVQISAVIKSYRYSERGTFKPNPGIGTMLLDAAATMTQNYVEMAVEYTVVDTKSDKVLWKNKVSDYIKRKMTPEESIPLISDRITKNFIWKCFGKANLRDSDRRGIMI